MTISRRLLLILAASTFVASVLLCREFAHEPYLRGADAYYYALQAEYWAKTGSVKIPDSSPIHRITGSIEKAGLTGESAVRVWETFSLFLLGLAALTLVSRRHDFKNVLLWFCLSLSPSLLFTAVEFPKFFSAILLVPLWYTALKSNFYPRRSAILLATLSVLLHRAALPLAVAFAVAVVIPGRRWTSLSRKTVLAFGSTCIVAVTGYWVIFRDHFHWLDLDRISFLSFQDARPGIVGLLSRPFLPWAIRIEVALVLVGFGIWTARRWKDRSIEWLLPMALCLPAFIPFGSEEVLGVGERYALLLPAFLVISMIFLSIKNGEPVRWARPQQTAAVFLAAAVPFFSGPRLDLAHPRSLDTDLPAFEQLVREISPIAPPMLIARKDFVFFYKFRLMREAFPYEPEDHWDKTRIWRLVYAVTPEEINYYLSERCGWEGGLVQSLPVSEYNLIREDCWEEMRAKISPSENPDLYHRVGETWLNPSRKRPSFLYPKHADEKNSEFPALAPKPGEGD